MAKKKEKQTNAKKKLGELLGKLEKKKAQIEHKRKQLEALEVRVAEFFVQNPELKPPAAEKPKRASRRKQAAQKTAPT